MEFIASEPGRLDAVLSSQDSALSRAKLQSAIKDGSVEVNGEVVRKPAHLLHEGDVVVFQVHDRPPVINTSIKPINQHVEVLYEDNECMVLNKPAGIAVHPGHAMDASEETLLSGIAFLFHERSIPFSPDSVLVHRLDKPTTGCILVAKSNNSFTELQKQFAERTTKKTYIAIVAGVPEHAQATIDAPIGRNLTDRTKMSVLKTSTSKEAQTDYQVLDFTQDCSVLSCILHTGRTHQIRVHLSSIGHPLLGDDTYTSITSKKLTEQYDIAGLCLHARSLSFVSPDDTAVHEVVAPFGDAFLRAAESTGLTITAEV